MEHFSKRSYSCASADSTCSNETDYNADSGVFEDGNISPLSGDFRTGESSAHFEVNARNEFNKNRKVIIRNVPPVTYEEVKEFLCGYIVSNISISKKSRHAIVTLVNGEEADEIAAIFDENKLLGMSVKVEVHPNENLLCVAHLPLNMDNHEFRKYLEPYGALERCFLMHNQFGTSKGYGYVEYAHNREKSIQVQRSISGQKLGSCTVHCDFVHESLVSFEQLDSLCLLVDHLPPHFKNQETFKRLFSEKCTPWFCQILARGEESLRCGVVAYKSAKDAEIVQKETHGKQIDSHTIRVTFCAPGYSPQDVCQRMFHKSPIQNQSLLPSPEEQQKQISASSIPSLLSLPLPNPPVSTGNTLANPVMQNLLSQNPQVLENFQSVLQQLQNQVWNQQQNTTSGKPGILGVAPTNFGNPLANPNLQIAILAVLLASQAQQNPSVLSDNPMFQQIVREQLLRPGLGGNPLISQANTMLQSLCSQEGQVPNLFPNQGPNQSRAPTPPPPVQQNQASVAPNSGIPPLMPGFAPNAVELQRLLAGVLQGNTNGLQQPTASQGVNPQNQARFPGMGILGEPPTGPKPGILGNPPPKATLPNQNSRIGLMGSGPQPHQFHNAPQRPLDNQPPSSSAGPRQNQAATASKIPSLLSLPFTGPPPGVNQPRPGGLPHSNKPVGGPPPVANPLLALAIELQIRQQFNNLQGNQTTDMGAPNGIFTFTGNQNGANFNTTNKSYAKTPGRRPPQSMFNFNGVKPRGPGTWNKFSDQENNPHAGKQVFQGCAPANQLILQPGNRPQEIKPPTRNSSQPINMTEAAPSSENDPTRSLNDTSNTLKRTASDRDALDMFSTPSAKRSRPLHLLPSPEASPDTDYVGQHSQGLGGHYASSYLKKRKL